MWIHRTHALSGINSARHAWGTLLVCWLQQRLCYLRFLCASYRSLYLTSTLSFLRLCDLLFLLKPKILPYCVHLAISYLLQSYLLHIFQNAYIFSSKFPIRVLEGLNVTHLIHLVSRKIKTVLTSCGIESRPDALGVILGGRIKGHIRNRKVREMIALMLGSHKTNRILDIGYKTSHSSLGLVGLKVASIM